MELSAHALRYFVALAEELHFGRAAARLHLATPSLSEQIARLEKRVQAELFERSPRGVTLTRAGTELLPLARDVVAAHDAVADWAVARRRAPSGRVRVGVFGAAAAPVRAAVLDELRREQPHLEVLTRRMGLDDVLAALREGGIDAAYLPEPLPPDRPGIRTVGVLRQPRFLVVPAGHRLAERDSVSIEETNREVFVSIATSAPERTAQWLVDPRADGSSPARGPAAADVEELLDLCAAGRGLALAAEAARSQYARPGIAFVPLDDVEEAELFLCWRTEERDPAVLAYVAVARRVAADLATVTAG